MNLGDLGTVIKTDLLIIGGGFGDMWAAIKARQNGVRNVAIVDKACVAFGGQSKMAAGATIYMHNDNDLADWVRAVFLGQQGMCNQDMVESMLIESTARLRELESWGIVYRKSPQGDSYMLMPARELSPPARAILAWPHSSRR